MKTKITLEKIIYIIILTIIIGTPLLKLLTYIPFVANLGNGFLITRRVYLLWGSIVFLFVTYLYGVLSEKTKINYMDIIVYVLLVLAVASTATAINFHMAFLGASYRYEGLLTIVSYYLIFLNSKLINNSKYKKNIIKVFICIGVFQAVYGFLQSFTELPIVRRYPTKTHMAMGLCSNPNFFGSYMIMHLLIASTLYIKNKKSIYILLMILFSIGLYSAQSSGPVLSMIITLVFMLIYFRKNLKHTLIVAAVVLCTFFITDKSMIYVQKEIFGNKISSQHNISEELGNTLNTIKEGDKDKIDKIGNGRVYVWKRSLPLLKKYWLFGAGLDNFEKAYPQIGKVRFDKAHNVYLQIGVTNGIPALVLYLSLCFIIFLRGFKLKDTLSQALFLAFVGYSIQAFANISVIEVAPYYFMILGFLSPNKKNEIKEGKKEIYSK